MTLAASPPLAAAEGAERLAPGEGGALRLRLYALCLVGSLAAFGAVHVWLQGLALAVPAAAAAAGLLLGLSAQRGSATAGRQRLLSASACLAVATALALPLGAAIAGGLSLPAAVRATTVWPQILVALFASRLLAELCDLRFAAFWRRPLTEGRPPRTQSMLAATALGAGLALVFYQFTAGLSVDAKRLDPPAIVWRALTGETAVHVAIIVLFFVVMAAILDATLHSLSDGAVLDALRRLCRERQAAPGGLGRAGVAELAKTRLASYAHSRTIQFVRDAAGGERAGARAPLETFHAASRRLIRALLSFLPLLGFLGTVIGLTAAIGSLPTGLGPASGGTLDISASLAGLAVKFETTLLGLSGGLLASLLLAVVERREAELAAECARLVEAAGDGR